MTVTVRRAALDDVDAVRAVGLAAWPPTYGPIHGDDYVARGLARWWSPEVVERGIATAPLRTYVAERRRADAAAVDTPDDVDGSEVIGGDVIGCAVVGELDGHPMLWKLYVRPDAQRTGAGTALLDAVVADLPADAQCIRLDHAVGNDRAHAFYVSQGFTEVGEYGAGEDAEMRMERRLP